MNQRPNPFSPPRNLRDEFATAALTGFLASEDQAFEMSQVYSPEEAAKRAYAIADAMMAEREKAESQP